MEDREILLALGRLEGKVDSLIATSKILNENINLHDQRIRALEGSKAMLVGVCSMAAGIVSLVISYLGT
tara:strand:+ start:303 stop:509 length:207 start_codon:yes stop_codon:yes gene_type:complete